MTRHAERGCAELRRHSEPRIPAKKQKTQMVPQSEGVAMTHAFWVINIPCTLKPEKCKQLACRPLSSPPIISAESFAICNVTTTTIRSVAKGCDCTPHKQRLSSGFTLWCLTINITTTTGIVTRGLSSSEKQGRQLRGESIGKRFLSARGPQRIHHMD